MRVVLRGHNNGFSRPAALLRDVVGACAALGFGPSPVVDLGASVKGATPRSAPVRQSPGDAAARAVCLKGCPRRFLQIVDALVQIAVLDRLPLGNRLGLPEELSRESSAAALEVLLRTVPAIFQQGTK